MPVLTTRHVSHRICSKMYETCNRSAMFNGNEMRGPNKPELQRLCHNDRAIIRWAAPETKCSQLHYYRHLALRTLRRSFAVSDSDGMAIYIYIYIYTHRAMSCIKSYTQCPIPGTRKQGRPRKSWSKCVKSDVNNCGLSGIDLQDRDAWRAGVQHSLVLLIP